MKNINLTKNKFIEKLNNYLNNNQFSFNLTEKTISESNWNYDIVIAGNKPFKYAIHDTDKGLSVTPQGQNQELANKILIAITSDASMVEYKKQEFVGIIPSVYDIIKNYYEKQEQYSVAETICSKTQTNLSIARNRQKIIIQYYPTTQNAILSGQSTYLWDDVFLELTSNLNVNAKEIVSLYIKSKEEMQSLCITYDEGILDEYIKCQIGKDAYLNEKLITKIEKNWLKTSAFLIFTEIQLPEYFACIASAIKIIEGLLNRICFKYLPKHSASEFDYFGPNQIKTKWCLENKYKSNFNNNSEIIHIVNDLYNFIHNNRHMLFHNDGLMPQQVDTKQKAVAIFQEIVTLLKKVQEKSDIIFN